MSGDPAVVLRRARAANTCWTVVSPLAAVLPRDRADVVAANAEAARVVRASPGLLQWVVVHPFEARTLEQARTMLQSPECVGIKIHPAQHGYGIAEQGRPIFELAAELSTVIQTHSGEAGCMPMDFVPLANEFHNVTVILAHLGYGGPTGGPFDLQVRAIQAAQHGNLLADTSSGRSITAGLVEWAVAEVGAENILYGTDTPLYFAPAQRARIERAELTDAQKRLILRENALSLLPAARNHPPGMTSEDTR